MFYDYVVDGTDEIGQRCGRRQFGFMVTSAGPVRCLQEGRDRTA